MESIVDISPLGYDLTSCAACGTRDVNLMQCGRCQNVSYCGEICQTAHWKAEHKRFCKFIPGTHVPTNAEAGPNPLDPALIHDTRRDGSSPSKALAYFCHYKYNKDQKHRVRMCKPGKLTPYIMNAGPTERRRRGFDPSEHICTPYKEEGSKQVPLPNGRFRHISSFSLNELRQLGWDGAMSMSYHRKGEWVPFVCGYDSDPDDEYQDYGDLQDQKIRNIIGLPADEVGVYARLPGKGVGKISNPKS